MSARACVAGVGMTPMGKHDDALPADLAMEAIAAALADARLPAEEIDGLFTCPQGFLRERERFLTQRMAQRLDLAPRAVLEVDAGGATSGLTFQAAARAVETGQCRCALVWASEIELRPEALMAEIERKGHLFAEANALFGVYDSAYGIVAPVAIYAMAVQRYVHEHRVPQESIARLAVVLREHAARHPLALFHEPITVEQVLASRMVAPPIHFLEACPWANGAAALVVAAEDVARATGRPVVRVEGLGEAHDAESFFPTRGDGGRFPSVERAAREALAAARAGIDDVGVVEVYGAFAGVELMCYEELGLFPRGHAAAAVAEGRTRVEGDRPCNPSGGRLSFGHPPYVTPLAEIAEIVVQLRGEAGARQVKNARLGLAQVEHGMVNGAWVGVLGRA